MLIIVVGCVLMLCPPPDFVGPPRSEMDPACRPKPPVVVRLRTDDKEAVVAARLVVGDTLLIKLPFRSNGYLWELMTEPLPKSLKLRGKPRLEQGQPGTEGIPTSRWMVFEFEAVAPGDRSSMKFEYVRHSGDRRSEAARTLDASILVLPPSSMKD